MANDLNQCSFIGRLGKDVDMRFTPEGKAVANFSIAVGSDWRDKNGNKQESTEWVNIACYDKLAEICGQFLSKGSQVYVQGRFKTEKWNDKQTNQERSAVRITAERVQFIGGKSENKGTDNEPINQNVGQPSVADNGGFDTMEDDIPF